MPKILIVEDEAPVSRLIVETLRQEWENLIVANNGHDALRLARQEHPDLILLDIMLPGVDGLEVCRQLQGDALTPIIFLTAKGAEMDRVIGLGMGADDYITKPFSPLELVARIKASLRRVQRFQEKLNHPEEAASSKRVEIGNVTLDMSERKVACDGKTIDLPFKEFEILSTLASRMNWVFSRDTLLYRIWGDDYFGDSRTVDVHVSRLRGRLRELAAASVEVKSVRNVGYRLQVKA
ncbi:MAG: response regulator transcription factor [Candidatus Sericytochromatia bacterium]|nr:response regulator transcription factor [Candidatus Sericytochromatia bacterium]